MREQGPSAHVRETAKVQTRLPRSLVVLAISNLVDRLRCTTLYSLPPPQPSKPTETEQERTKPPLEPRHCSHSTLNVPAARPSSSAYPSTSVGAFNRDTDTPLRPDRPSPQLIIVAPSRNSRTFLTLLDRATVDLRELYGEL